MVETKPCFIIAEAGVNHNGDLTIAKKMVEVAKLSGADAVKFQTFIPELLISRFTEKAPYQKHATGEEENMLEMVRPLTLDAAAHRELIQHCNEAGIMFLSTPYDEPSVDLLVELGVETFKIASADVVCLPMLKKIGALKKRVILSTGMATIAEIDAALKTLVEAGTPKEKITLLQCHTDYPTRMQDVNLRAMVTMRETFGVSVGYSDHTAGMEASIAAVSLGATMIEKHFTLDRTMSGPDHAASLEPADLKAMVVAIRNIEQALGDGVKRPSERELDNMKVMRRSIVAARDIAKGEVFDERNLIAKRPGTGISPMLWDDVIGQVAGRDFMADELIELPRIPVAKTDLSGNELKYVSECLSSNWISSQGRFVKEFEEKMAAYTGTKYAVAVSNGTTALHLALVGLGIGKGDEVIVPSLTFIATANAVTYTGATPIFVDSEKDSWGLDPRAIERAITPRTKAIMPVHLYGKPAKMDAIMAIAKKHNLFVIEDAAEAHGAEYQGVKVGSIGDIGCFSFFGNKIITTGEGGMVVTSNEQLYEKMLMLRDHGMSKDRRYWHSHVGFNYRMTNIQAAIGCAQLERINEIISARERIREMYNQYLSPHGELVVPLKNADTQDVCWLYTVLLNEERVQVKRDAVLVALNAANIECRPMFYPLHTMPPYFIEQTFPVAEALSRNGITLPSYVGLGPKEIQRVCKTLVRALV